MKSKNFYKIISVLFMLLFLFGCKKESENNLDTKTSESTFKEIHELDNGDKILSQIDDFKFKYNGELIKLADALNSKIISIDYLINKMEYKDMANDGGSKLYYYDGKKNDFKDEEFYLVKCHAFNGQDENGNTLYNTNIIIGTSSNIVNEC